GASISGHVHAPAHLDVTMQLRMVRTGREKLSWRTVPPASTKCTLPRKTTEILAGRSQEVKDRAASVMPPRGKVSRGHDQGRPRPRCGAGAGRDAGQLRARPASVEQRQSSPAGGVARPTAAETGPAVRGPGARLASWCSCGPHYR